MEKLERRATWLELFYDLVFVIVIAKLSHFLLVTPTFCGLLVFIALFFMTWWVWMGFSYYADMYERDHKWFRGVYYLSMIGIIIFAINVQNLAIGHYKDIILSYIALRLLLWVVYAVTWYRKKGDRPFLIFYVLGFATGSILWSIGLIAPLYFCLIGFIIEFLTPLIAYMFAKVTPKQVSHLDERFGLFLLIVLGETIASVTFATQESNWNWHNIIICVSSFVIAVSMWKIYFSKIQENTVYKALRGTRLSMMRSFVFGNSHVFIAISIVLFGVSLEWMVLKETSLNPIYAYTLSLALFMGIVTFNQWAAHVEMCKTEWSCRYIAIAIILVLGFSLSHALWLALSLAVLSPLAVKSCDLR